MSYSGEYITVTDATQEALDLKANLSGNQFTETQYFKGHIVMNGDNNGDRLILTSNIINPSDTDLILNGVEGNNVRAKLQGAFGAPVGQFQIDNGDCNILSSQNKYLINGVDVIGNLETQLQTEIQTGLSGKANLSGGNTFTGQQIMADLELNGLNVKGSLILYEPDSSIFTRKISAIDGPQTNLDVNGNMNLINNPGQAFVHEYKINGTNILDPYRTSADTDTLLNEKAPINDADLTGHTKMTRLTVNHSDSGTIGLDFNNTNVNQYAGAFNTAGYGWRFYNDNLSQVNNITFGVYTKGTGSQLNPLLIKNDGKLYTLDQEVDGDVNLSAGHEYKISGTNILDPYRTSADTDTLLNQKANDNEVVKLSGSQTITGTKSFNNGIEINNNSSLFIASGGNIFIGETSLNAYPESFIDKSINGTLNTITNIDNSAIKTNAGIEYSKLNIADGNLTIAKTNGLQGALDDKAPINDADLTGHTKMTRLTVNHSDSGSVGLDFNNTNVNQYAGGFNTAGYGWRFFNDNLSQVNNITFGVYTKGTGSQLNPLLVKNDGKLYTLDQEVDGNVNLSAGHEYKISGTNILDPYRTSADTDTLLNLKAPINDSNLTGHTIMTRLTVNHSDSGTIGLDFNNTNVNQYAGGFNTAGYGWRFFNDNLSQVNNITFGVYTKGTGSQLNPLLIKNDGKLYTLDQEVDGDVNLSAGHEYKINGTSLKNVVETVTNKTIDANNNTINNIKNAINNNDLTIAQTNGLQTELDEKQIRYLPCLIEHAEPSGTDGGTAVATSWNDIVLNTIDDTLRTDYTIGSNQITIATVGTYEISFSVASYSTLGTKGQVIGVTDVGKIINGTSFTTTNASGGMSNGMGVITTTQANEVFKLRVYCGGAGLLGKAVGSGISETYAQVFIKRLS
jgi:hypothetical protein